MGLGPVEQICAVIIGLAVLSAVAVCIWSNVKAKAKPKLADETTIIITATMRSRWVPHFLAMLKYMERLGGLGSSRKVSFYSDGDGDFRPRFKWNESLPSDAAPVEDHGGDRFYDAG